MKIARRAFLKQSSLFTVATCTLPINANIIEKESIKFGIATDSHYADRSPVGTRYYRGSLEKMREFVNQINLQKVDFAIHLGDFKDQSPEQKETDTLRFLQEIEAVYADFNGPRYHCIGNHDVDSITKQQFISNVTNTNITTDKGYYSFDGKGFHCVVLDANHHEDGSDHFFREGANWQDTNLGKEQLLWLQNDLKTTEKPTIIFCHHPLFEYHRDGHKYHANDYQKVQSILEKFGNVLAVFQGHVHDESYKKINGIHYLTHFGMVDYEGLENNSFAIVEITNDTLKVHGYKRTKSQSLKY